MKKNKIIGIALALTLTAIPGIETFVPFAPSSTAIEVSAAVGQYDECLVTTLNDGLNLRKGPGTNYSVVTTIPHFAKVETLTKPSNGWVKVEYETSKKTYTGYVSVNYLSKISCYVVGTQTHKVGKNVVTGLNLREGPGTKYNVKTSIPKGSKIQTYGMVVNRFVQVKYGNYKGWASVDYIDDFWFFEVV